ncbi:MAG TPA: cytochrome c peroxidase [Ideonella sp.]|nr:cytochrome c peroxidase [Ideonella sp.]
MQGLASCPAGAQELSDAQRAAYRRPDSIPFPKDNPYTPEKAALGKMLFFDTRLSRDKNLSCASCHNPSFGWEVPFATAIGAGGKPLGRHAPTALNQAWSKNYFWDGRAPTLEAQAKGPIEAAVEMDLPMATAVARLKEVRGYVDAFSKAFPKDGLGEETVLKAIATFERTIVTGDTPFDRWVRGDNKSMSTEAKRGFALFAGKANCAACHSGWNFTDDKFHDIGLPTADPGRMGITNAASDQHAFKTPSLREIAARAPFMHHGQVATLEAVTSHYITGGQKRPSLDAQMRPLSLSGQDVQDLSTFMRSLSSPQTTLAMPNLPSH